ncbi:MAG: glycine betaine ABC transporter substrate-binding protein [Pseudomonadota bacterium]
MRRCYGALLLMLLSGLTFAAPSITIGSKNFTENYLLAEILAQRLEQAGIDVERRFGLGGTKICFDALGAGEIDIYPEYSGTISAAILKQAAALSIAEPLAAQGLMTHEPIGFNNTYVLAMRESVARERGITRISDLAGQQDLNIALSHEFRARGDGWPPLAAQYGLNLPTTGIEHALAYAAMQAGQVDLTDAYSTDGELARYPLQLLKDDRGFFPRYDALWLSRTDLDPAVRAILAAMAGSISEQTMQSLNARVAIDGESVSAIAAEFIADSDPTTPSATRKTSDWSARLLTNTLTHIQLTMTALGLAAVFGVGLALLVQPMPRVSAGLLYVCGLAQTVPSIALLALMIPLLGIGKQPAIVALFVYALLPIVRATLTAVNALDPIHLTVADALGMSTAEKRRYVQIPLAMPHIIAGLRTAAVISIGTATLAAFIGAGGLGQPIVTGLALNDTDLIMQGAIPAALLAILTDLGFDALERRLVPTHLRAS